MISSPTMTPRAPQLPPIPLVSSPEREYPHDSIRPGSRDSNCSDTSMTSDSAFSSAASYTQTLDRRSHNSSPFSRGHIRPLTASNNLAAPHMTRTKSLPTVPAHRNYSPSHSPLRQASPTRSPAMPPRASPRSSFDSPSTSFMDIVSIAEDEELDITPRPSNSSQTLSRDFSSSSMSASFSSGGSGYLPSGHTFSRSNSFSRRRPASPLSQTFRPPPPPPPAATTTSTAGFIPSGPNSPLTPPSSTSRNYNESYPGFLSAASSVPSTPTSLRSRSPSISSLETIPDTPDAELAAIEAYEIARLKAAADAADDADAEEEGRVGFRRSSADGSGGRGGSWWSNSRDKNRKRWSVSGAERRGDFEMETIWED